MPYNSKYKKYTKRYNKRRSYQSKSRFNRYAGYAGTVMSTATKALILAHGIKKLMNVEFKFHDVQTTQTDITTTANIIQLTNIPQGDISESRDGAQVKVTRLQIKYQLRGHVNAVTTLVRCIVVKDSQTNQAIYAIADLLQDTTANDSIVSMLNLDNKYRFTVLYNKVHQFQNSGHNNNYTEIIKDLDLRLRFDASTPSIADLTSASLSIIFISDQASNSPLLTLFSRVRYVDN